MSGLIRSTAVACTALLALAMPVLAADPPPTRHRTVAVDGVNIFYREAGDTGAPAVLLLHGLPTSSYMFRDLIPLLADRYRVVAPDLPGFGFSDAPDRTTFTYSFANLASTIDRFTEVLGLGRFALYVFDYGAPVGFRMAVAHPERITAIVSQNGNVYDEGLSPRFSALRKVWADPTPENRNTLRGALTPEANLRRYYGGLSAADKPLVRPESLALDAALLARPGIDEIQLDLLADYGSNVAQYPAYQQYLRAHKPPLLAIWGRNDQTFVPAGAEAFKRDVPMAEIRLLDTGHFALETHGKEIAEAMLAFLGKHLRR